MIDGIYSQEGGTPRGQSRPRNSRVYRRGKNVSSHHTADPQFVPDSYWSVPREKDYYAGHASTNVRDLIIIYDAQAQVHRKLDINIIM